MDEDKILEKLPATGDLTVLELYAASGATSPISFLNTLFAAQRGGKTKLRWVKGADGRKVPRYGK